MIWKLAGDPKEGLLQYSIFIHVFWVDVSKLSTNSRQSRVMWSVSSQNKNEASNIMQ